MVAQTITSWNKPNLQSYIPTDWFKASSSLPEVSDSELQQAIEKIKKQLNAIRVMRANLSLTKAIIGTDKNIMAVDAQLEMNGIHAAKLNTRIDFERMKLAMDQSGFAQLGQLYGQQWQQRIQKKQEALTKSGNGTGQPAPNQPAPVLAEMFGSGDRLDAARMKAQEMRGFLNSVQV